MSSSDFLSTFGDKPRRENRLQPFDRENPAPA
jgi:hypothetical protein